MRKNWFFFLEEIRASWRGEMQYQDQFWMEVFQMAEITAE